MYIVNGGTLCCKGNDPSKFCNPCKKIYLDHIRNATFIGSSQANNEMIANAQFSDDEDLMLPLPVTNYGKESESDSPVDNEDQDLCDLLIRVIGDKKSM